MSGEIPIPLWLKQKSSNRREENEGKTGRLMPVMLIGTLVSYFGLMAAHAAKIDEQEKSVEKSTPYAAGPARGNEILAQAGKNELSLRALNDRDLADMESRLLAMHRHIADGKGVNECGNIIREKFNAKSMILPSLYSETLCYAEAGRELYEKLHDIVYLELAQYYYKRCLYLIDGQLEGRFRKPRGGEKEIRERQESVYIALDDLKKAGR